MRKNLLFFLMAMLLPCLAWADNMAISKTLPSYSYYNKSDNRLVVPVSVLGLDLPMNSGRSYAIAEWIKPSSVNYSYGGVLMDFGTYEHMNFNGNWNLSVTSGAKLKLNGHGGATDHGIEGVGSLGDTELTFNDWSYVLNQYDADTRTMSVYLNGEKIFTKTFDKEIYYPWDDGEFHILGFGIAALIDEVHVFNKALTDEEVKQAYQKPTSMGSLVGYYTFDEQNSDGTFPNLAANAPQNSDATWVLFSGNDYWPDGIVNGKEAAASATLVEGRVASSYSLTIPSAPENVEMVIIYLPDGVKTSVTNAGEVVSGLDPGTEITIAAAPMAGYLVAALTVDGVEVELETIGTNQARGKFTLNSDLDESSYVWTITRTPFVATIEQPENAVITVMNGDKKVESGDKVPAGTELTLSAVCESGYKISQYTLNGQPVEGTTVEVPEEDFTISATVTGIDYCESTATVSRTDRYISSLNVNGTSIAGPGSANPHPLYVDRTSDVVTVTAGDDVTITTVGGGEWMHHYIYMDFGKDGWDVDEEITQANGDLVWFNFYRRGESGSYYNHKGEQLSSSYTAISGVEGSFTVPADLEPGDYRVRFKTDWSCTNPCGNSASGNLITSNGGSIIDFTLRVESPYLENERTITIATSDAEAGTVEFVQPESDELSVSTALKKVIVKATPAEGAEFIGWYKADACLSEDPEYVIESTEDLSIQANFMWSAQYTVTIEQPENGTLTVSDGSYAINSGDQVLANTTLTLSASANSGYSFQNFIVNGEETTETTIKVHGDVTISANITEGVEYCELQGSKSSSRYVTSLTVSDGKATSTVTVGDTSKSQVYVDCTESKVTVEPGAEVTVTSVGSGSWMHSYLFVDLDNNGWNVDEDAEGVNGDLVWFNAHSTNGYEFYDSEGNSTTMQQSVDKQVAKFTVPMGTPAGEYRVRYKVDWLCLNPCGRWSSLGYDGNYIDSNCGNIIDFILVVEASQLEEERTITVAVAEDQEEMGEVSLPEFEGTSVTTDNRYVTIKATAFEGAQFMNWTRDGEVISTEAEIVVQDASDATYVANFGWTVNYTIGSNGSFQVKAEGAESPLQSGAAVAPGTKLIATAVPDKYMVIDEFTNNGVDLEAVDGVAEIIVSGPVSINVTFKDEEFNLSIATEGNGAVEVWTESDMTTDEPAGEQLADGAQLTINTEYIVYVMPEVDGDNAEEITFVLIKNGNDEDITLDNLEDYGWNCTYNENYLIFPIVTSGNVSVEAHFSTGMAAIGDIVFDGIEGEVEFYNLQGVRVDAENVQTGFYIVRKGDKAVKMFIRK
ncbi:MAG: hypothetical protein K2I26_01050 [Paramuribaculum sp.]|nr:hypothetical protein [Paramuribaculum sp.]